MSQRTRAKLLPALVPAHGRTVSQVPGELLGQLFFLVEVLEGGVVFSGYFFNLYACVCVCV